MKILQVNSDWKWTGPAEPMLTLLAGLRERGHEADLVCPESPIAGARGLADEARARGFDPALGLEAFRGIRWRRDLGDVRRLRDLIDERDVDVVHTWHTRDHSLALRATSGRRRRTRVVRSVSNAERISATPWNRWLFGPGSDGLLCASPETASQNRPLRGGRPILGCLGAVDLERFEAFGRGRDPRAEKLREELGIGKDEEVVGVVARIQRHRRFDLLFEAMAHASQTRPRLRMLVLGRGTHADEVAKQPVAKLGLEDRVSFAGYRTEDYVAALAAMDLLTFLVPGSDGSCRAVLEAAACAVPAVASRRGGLPEIVLDGETGLLVDESPEALSDAWSRLLDDEVERRTLGENAWARARKLFNSERLASEVEGLYRAL